MEAVTVVVVVVEGGGWLGGEVSEEIRQMACLTAESNLSAKRLIDFVESCCHAHDRVDTVFLSDTKAYTVVYR